ncbi:hypothetical protein DPMN_003092 [Dreissena polymorpha]|uniref:Uncharacterized protein n=1 Tax=Dreissena polymorpha TaxID=45954 RepID=A0A9D4MN72_DREPO|nr:hypothetical protein DPMN_003092 [Dreissena polymorpha]
MHRDDTLSTYMIPRIPEHRSDTTCCSYCCCCCFDRAIDRDGASPDAKVATSNPGILNSNCC